MPYSTDSPVDYKALYDEEYYKSRGMKFLFETPYDRKHADQFVEKLRRAAPLGPQTRVLDLAFGIGYRPYFMSPLVAHIDAVDISPFAVEFAKKTYAQPNVVYHESDILAWTTDAKYDLVLLVSIYEHLTKADQDKLLERIKPWLNPGGRVCVHVAIGESFLGRRKAAKNRTGTIDFTGDHTHLHSFDVPTIMNHFKDHGYRLAAEYRRYGSFGLSGKNLDRLFRWFHLPQAWRDDFVVELLPAFELGGG